MLLQAGKERNGCAASNCSLTFAASAASAVSISMRACSCLDLCTTCSMQQRRGGISCDPLNDLHTKPNEHALALVSRKGLLTANMCNAMCCVS